MGKIQLKIMSVQITHSLDAQNKTCRSSKNFKQRPISTIPEITGGLGVSYKIG
jgi:hypothetical protein